jgi:hypothetical protein
MANRHAIMKTAGASTVHIATHVLIYHTH